jgi:HD-GYP domain-containing protein (c-di-GMP phosphodiesterase class II)
VTELSRAALVHDLGKVAVPSAVLQKNGDLSDSEREEFRQHSYYTERILSRVDRLSPLASEAGSHHEWLNGHGYHRELLGEQIPMGGRWRSRTPMRRR